MEVTWRQLEKIIMSSIETAVRTTVIETERQYAASYAGKSSSLSSVGNYATFISRAGTSVDGAVMPVASPRSSVWKNPKRQPTPMSHAYMMEVGGQMDLIKYIRSGYKNTSYRRPAVPRYALMQSAMNATLVKNMINQGFTK